MAAPVPFKRTEPVIGDVLIGAPVRAQTWRELAMLLHWLRAHGMHVIPAHSPQLHITTTSSPESLFYRVKPQGLAISRVWVIGILQDDFTAGGGTVPSYVTVTLPSTQTAVLFPGAGASDSGRHVLIETVSKSSAEADLELKFERTSGTTPVTVTSVDCYELPRAVLTLDTTDKGVDFETVRPGAALYDSSNRSIGAIVENLADAVSWPRRMLLEQAFPELASSEGAAANPTAWQDIWPFAMPCLPRKVAVGDTVFAATWTAYVKVDASTTFELRITSGNSANTDTKTITNTTYAMASNSTIQLDNEDPSQDDGVPTGGSETVQVAWRRTSGTGEIGLRGVYVWEAS